MTSNIERFTERSIGPGTEMRYGYEFDCIKCHFHIYSAVHYGHKQLCLTCQFMMEMELDAVLQGQDT